MKKFFLFLASAAIVCAQAVIPWTDVDKTGASLSDLTTRNAADLTSGTLPDARFPATLPAVSGANLTALNATQLTSGTLPAARLPAFSGDITTSAGSAATTLANLSPNPAGTYRSVSVNSQGRVVGGANPTTLAGYSISDAYTSTTVDQMTSSRAVKDALYSDGSTSGRGAVWTLGSAGAVAGMPITIPFEFDVPTVNPIADAFVFVISGSSTPGFNTDNTLSLRIGGSGAALTLDQRGTTGSTDTRQMSWTGFRTAYSGVKGLRGAIVFETADTTAAPKIYLQGVDASANFSAVTGGAPPNWMPATLATSKFLVGYGWQAGRIVPHAPRLGAWSASEASEWTSTGRAPAWDEIGTGTAAGINANPSLAIDATGWTIDNGGGGAIVSAGRNTSSPISGAADYKLSVTVAGSDNAYPRINVSPTPRIELRHTYAYSFKIKRTGGTLASFILAYGVSGSSGYVLQSQALDGTLQSFAGTFTATVATSIGVPTFILNGTNAFDVQITDFQIIPYGPIFRPVIQPIAIVADASTNAISGVLTGMTPLTTRRDWIIQASTSTNGNQQLLGASPFFDYTRNVLDDWTVNNKGGSSRTISLGQASAGTQYLSGGTAATGRNVVTLVTRVVGANALWCNSNGTDSLQHTVRGHIVD